MEDDTLTPEIDALQRISDAMEKKLDAVVDHSRPQWTRAIQAQLRAWEARYPRHKFKTFDAMGMMSVEVNPPIYGESCVEDLTVNRVGRVNAITKLATEAQALLDVWNKAEWRIMCATEHHTTEA